MPPSPGSGSGQHRYGKRHREVPLIARFTTPPPSVPVIRGTNWRLRDSRYGARTRGRAGTPERLGCCSLRAELWAEARRRRLLRFDGCRPGFSRCLVYSRGRRNTECPENLSLCGYKEIQRPTGLNEYTRDLEVSTSIQNAGTD